jgi:hypothetical protein
MEWLAAAEYSLAREVTQRLLGLVYLVAFLSAYNQFPALCGERGLTPIGRFLAGTGFRRSPSLVPGATPPPGGGSPRFRLHDVAASPHHRRRPSW